jgi:hypothetical protein
MFRVDVKYPTSDDVEANQSQGRRKQNHVDITTHKPAQSG